MNMGDSPLSLVFTISAEVALLIAKLNAHIKPVTLAATGDSFIRSSWDKSSRKQRGFVMSDRYTHYIGQKGDAVMKQVM